MVNYILEGKTVNRMSIMFMKSALPFFQNSKLPYKLHLASLVENWPNTNKHNNRKHSCVFRKRVLIHLMIMTIWKHRDPFLSYSCRYFLHALQNMMLHAAKYRATWTIVFLELPYKYTWNSGKFIFCFVCDCHY